MKNPLSSLSKALDKISLGNIWIRIVKKNPYLFFTARMVTLFWGGLLMLFAGTQLAFGSYAPSVKERLKYTQEEINTLGIFENMGNNLGILPAIFLHFFGPQMTCILASMLTFSGYFVLYCNMRAWISWPPMVNSILMLLTGNGNNSMYSIATQTNIENFPITKRGTILGLLTALYGISAAFFALIYHFGVHDSAEGMLLFMPVSVAACCLLSMPFMFKWGTHAGEEKTVETEPLVINDQETYGAIPDDDFVDSLDDTNKKVKPRPQPRQLNPIRMLLSLDFYIFYIMMYAAAGTSLIVSNNIGSMVIALGGEAGSQYAHVILLATMNCIGRITFGFLSDIFSKYASRPMFLTLAITGIGLGAVVFALSTTSNSWLLYIGCIITGFSSGGLWSISPAVIGDLFGKTFFAINFAIAISSSALGGYTMVSRMAGSLYQMNVDGNGNDCYGQKCYYTTFVISAFACVAAISLGFLLTYRTKRFYFN